MLLVGYIIKEICYDARSHERKKMEMKNFSAKISHPSVKNEKVTVDCILRSCENVSYLEAVMAQLSVLQCFFHKSADMGHIIL
jgi:hypothetical protein